MDEVIATMDISEANEGYASCGSVIEMSRQMKTTRGLNPGLPVPGYWPEEEDIVSCLPKLQKTAGSASEVEEAVKPAVKQE
uniref:Zinc knuckle containing protein-like n=1 Tax=Oryza sativa subsp. japonica TaxID=39947 RepID=Q5Z454_ORYSJ|nr:Zinc knuckle containing protein-like [Oryza sativa Japonica Group]BAD62459.1 Zinc knuckle containing protein-like [Oryza sativa Japonica Group]